MPPLLLQRPTSKLRTSSSKRQRHVLVLLFVVVVVFWTHLIPITFPNPLLSLLPLDFIPFIFFFLHIQLLIVFKAPSTTPCPACSLSVFAS